MAKVTINGEKFDYDNSRLLNTEAIALQKVTGMTVQEWSTALKAGDAFALTGLVWLIWRRDGRETTFDAVEFDIATMEIEDDEPAAEPQEVPTAAADAAESPA